MPELKPYLIRAIYDWINDCELTPYLLIQADEEKATLPMDLANNGSIVLNIRPAAVQNLLLENNHIEFDAAFQGQSMHVYAPIELVLAIFAKENGEGMFFDQVQDKQMPSDEQVSMPSKMPGLKVVK